MAITPPKPSNKNLDNCKDCGGQVSKNAKTCPHCGTEIKKNPIQTGCGLILLIMIAFFVFSVITKDKKPDKIKTPQLTEMQKAQKKAAYEKEKKEKYELCKKDLQCWGDKHSFKATIASEKIIEKHAKYSFKWTDGWLGSKMTQFRWKKKDKLTLTYFGDQIQFQNGFGAWQDMTYQCDYDPVKEIVLGVRVYPGRL